eukprot:310407_1
MKSMRVPRHHPNHLYSHYVHSNHNTRAKCSLSHSHLFLSHSSTSQPHHTLFRSVTDSNPCCVCYHFTMANEDLLHAFYPHSTPSATYGYPEFVITRHTAGINIP